jgi:arabinose-5-phosphate isomerase
MIREKGREALKIEAEGIHALIDRIDQSFVDAVEEIIASKGRVVVTGMGKSGIIGRKIVATLNSTGTPAMTLHPVDALHGDLGMVRDEDILLALSYSGETEVNAVLPLLKKNGTKVISLTGNINSTLASLSDIVLDVSVEREACPMGLAPTTSTTAALAMGDALAVALMHCRGFNSDDFKKFHPGGNLGERLSVQVSEVMAAGDDLPVVLVGSTVTDAIEIMNRLNLGVVLIADDEDVLKGIFTDGDLRRCLANEENPHTIKLDQLMKRDPKTIEGNRLAVEALEIMQKHSITILPIVDKEKKLAGVVHLHALLGKGSFKFNAADF